MSKSKSTPALAEALSQAQSLGSQFEYESTRLSEMLLEVEAVMARLPGKVAVEVDFGQQGKLYFRRVGTDWHIVFGNASHGFKFVTDAPVDLKIEAALALPYLVAQLAGVHEAKLTRIREAIGAIESVLPTITRAAKEGA